MPAKFTICNSGKDELHKDQLFKRFTSAYTNSTGSGLGLSIVKEICNHYNWKIDYTFKNEMHTFSILF